MLGTNGGCSEIKSMFVEIEDAIRYTDTLVQTRLVQVMSSSRQRSIQVTSGLELHLLLQSLIREGVHFGGFSAETVGN